MKNKIAIDAFLEEETNQETLQLFTIEKVENEDDKIKITPWHAGECGCENGLIISKDLIDSVEKTGKSHACCGKLHSIVTINFKENASISILDVLSQISAKNHGSETVSENEFEADFENDEFNVVPVSMSNPANSTLPIDLDRVCLPNATSRKRKFRWNGRRFVPYFECTTIYKNRFTDKICKVETREC